MAENDLIIVACLVSLAMIPASIAFAILLGRSVENPTVQCVCKASWHAARKAAPVLGIAFDLLQLLFSICWF